MPTTFFINEWLRPPKDEEASLIGFYPMATEFSRNESQINFKTCLEASKREVWFMSTTFRDTIIPYRKLILEKLSEGINMTFLAFNPESNNLIEVASSFNLTPEALKSECEFSLHALHRLIQEYESTNGNRSRKGELKVKLYNEVPRSRVYIYDPTSSDGTIFLVPYINRTFSDTYSGYLIPNSLKTKNIRENYLLSVTNLSRNAHDLTI